ncbi:MAG TPA: RNB domain-containing ribonuclease [Motilibacteraceae bacterium]|nr:RNB domain-containing ribonuclease [Motilibacteraceae bacterium]
MEARDLPLVTIDPAGSTDLDQALHIARRAPGFRVSYAIADVAAFVPPGGPVDVEAHARVETLYAPDEKTPLHPAVLSEGAASLLPGQDRPALLWQLDLDADGQLERTEVRRAVVRSRRRLSYEESQQLLDGDSPPEVLELLRVVGRLREQIEADRGGVSLPIPEQEVVPLDGGYALALRSSLPVEGWNAQLSLLTGMAAAQIVLESGVGILRTLPPARDEDVQGLRRAAAGLGVAWAAGESYPELVRRLDPAVPTHAALLQEATGLMRGAGYLALDGGGRPEPERLVHAAIAAPYSHVTAPLRRLVDRYAGEACVAACAGVDVPEWVLAALLALPEEMARGDRKAGELDRACVDLVEAALLTGREGETFPAVVVDVSATGGVVQLADPPVRGRCDGAGLPLGERVVVRLVTASVDQRTVRFEPAAGPLQDPVGR